MAFKHHLYNPRIISSIRLSICGVAHNYFVTKSFVKGQDVGVIVAMMHPSRVIYKPGYLLRQA